VKKENTNIRASFQTLTSLLEESKTKTFAMGQLFNTAGRSSNQSCFRFVQSHGRLVGVLEKVAFPA